MNPAAIRRTIHASSASVLLLAYLGSVDLLRFSLIAGMAIALPLEYMRLRYPAVGGCLNSLVPVFRASESNGVSGATWLCVGYAAASWCPLPAATSGILVGALADPAASLFGSMFNSKGVGKTWAGSAAAAATATLVLLPLGIPLVAVIAGAVAAMVLERWPGPLNDNLTVPIGVSLVVWCIL
jgi:dolichol kinase